MLTPVSVCRRQKRVRFHALHMRFRRGQLLVPRTNRWTVPRGCDLVFSYPQALAQRFRPDHHSVLLAPSTLVLLLTESRSSSSKVRQSRSHTPVHACICICTGIGIIVSNSYCIMPRVTDCCCPNLLFFSSVQNGDRKKECFGIGRVDETKHTNQSNQSTAAAATTTAHPLPRHGPHPVTPTRLNRLGFPLGPERYLRWTQRR